MSDPKSGEAKGEPAERPEIQPIDEKPEPVKDERKLSEIIAAVGVEKEKERQAREAIAAVKPLTFRMPGADKTNLAEINSDGVISVFASLTPVQAKALAAWINEVVDV